MADTVPGQGEDLAGRVLREARVASRLHLPSADSPHPTTGSIDLVVAVIFDQWTIEVLAGGRARTKG